MRKKLRSRRGLTITELLVTVLLLSIMGVGVAVGVSSSLTVYRESTLLSDGETLCSTLSALVMDELRFAENPESGDMPRYTRSANGIRVQLGVNGAGHLTVGNDDLLGSGAYTGLTAGLRYSYDSGTGVFDVTVTVSQKGGGTPIQTAKFQVKPQT